MTGRNLYAYVFLIAAAVFLIAAAAVFTVTPAMAGAGHHDRHVAQMKEPEATIGKVQLAPGLHMAIGSGGFTGGNVAILSGPDGLLIVDDKLANFSGKLAEVLDSFGKGRPKYVLNTHWHFDHTGGNKTFGDAVIVAHDQVREKLSKPQELKVFGRTIPASPPEALPDVTYSDTMTIHFNGEEIQITHLPGGHTGGDSIVYFKNANVLHLGDLFFNGLFPFCDTEHGGNVFGMAKNVAELLKRFPADVKIIPGHGPLATMSELKTYHEMLTATSDHVLAGARAQGSASGDKRLEALQAAGLPEKWKSWAWRIDEAMWIKLIFLSLK